MHVLKGCTRLFGSLLIGLPFIFTCSSTSQADIYFNQPLVHISWTANKEGDTKGYEVHRATALNGTYTKISGNLVATTSYADGSVSGGNKYYYKLKAVDTCGNTSAYSTVSDAAVIDLTSPVVTASPAGGSYSQSINVTLQSSETVTIYYTKDGSTPTRSSAVYSSPILISVTTTLKYFAVDQAQNQGPVATSNYTINSSSNDYDNDGYSNSLETSMGTDPYNAASQPKASSLALAQASGPIRIGATEQLSVMGTFTPTSGGPINYDVTKVVQYTSDSANVTVSSSGLVTGKSEGIANVTAKQVVNGATTATSNSIRITVDATPPYVDSIETRPYKGQGTYKDLGPTPRVPLDTGVIIRVVDPPVGDNIGIDEGTIQLLINGAGVPAKVREVISGDAHEFDIAYQNKKAFQYEQLVSVDLSLADMAGNQMSYTQSFQVENILSHQQALAKTPPQSTVAAGATATRINVQPASDSINDEALKGAAITYNNYEPVKPRVGPVDEIPALDIATPAGIPMNVEPAGVFDGPVTLILPVPNAQLQDTDNNGVPDKGLEAYEVYQFLPNPSVQWRNGADASGWMVQGSRKDHYETTPPTIEVQVNQACAVQVGAADMAISPVPDVKVNGQDGAVSVAPADNLDITVNLAPGNVKQKVDWWILAETPNGWYHLDVKARKWEQGMAPSDQSAPYKVSNQPIYTKDAPFGAGTYTIHFAMDDNADGQYDKTWEDSIQVTVK